MKNNERTMRRAIGTARKKSECISKNEKILFFVPSLKRLSFLGSFCQTGPAPCRSQKPGSHASFENTRLFRLASFCQFTSVTASAHCAAFHAGLASRFGFVRSRWVRSVGLASFVHIGFVRSHWLRSVTLASFGHVWLRSANSPLRSQISRIRFCHSG